jgi:iron complex outermembrane recepter protein
MKQFFCLLLLSTCLWNKSVAQIAISGVVKNQKSIAIDDATVTVTLLSDTTKKAIATSNDKGFFRATVSEKGTYRMVITADKCKANATVITINEDKNIGTVTLQESNSIEGVKVVAEKVVVKSSVDKKVYNVGQDITAVGGSASDVLKNVPSLSIDPVDGDVAIRGNENVLVLVDGKPSTLLGSDIATILQSIPAASIETVEVINNPGAQYDAQGKAGVLNIILKKDRKPGYNGNVGVTVGLPQRLNINAGFNANVKKWNFFGNVGIRTAQSMIVDRIERKNYLNDTTNVTDAITSRLPKSGFMNIGTDYSPNKFNKFSLSLNSFAANMSGDINTDINKELHFETQMQRINRYNTYTGRPRNATASFNYTHTAKKTGAEWKTDASLGMSRYSRSSEIMTDTFNAANTAISANNFLSIPVEGGNNNFTVSTDYSTPISKLSKIDAGLKFIDFRFHSENFPISRYQGGADVSDVRLKNKFRFTQNTYAAYTNYKTSYKTWGLQLGARLEHFVYDGFVYQYNQGLYKPFTNVFPSAYISKKIKRDAEFTLSYIKRVNRPNFFNLVPYIDVTNPSDTGVGNPNLKPEFIHASELSYSMPMGRKNNLLASVYYQFNENLIQRYKRFNTDGTTFSQPQNINSGVTYGAEVNVKYYILQNWDANLNLNVFANNINGTNIDASIKTNGWSGFAKLISNYKLNKKWDFQLTSNYQAPAVVAQGKTKAYYNVDIAIKTTLLKNALTLSLSGNDIFNTVYQGTEYNVLPYYYQYNYRKNQTQQITLGAQFRFMSKSTNPAEVKEKKFNKRGSAEKENKDVKSRDENLKKDEDREDNNNNSGGNNGPK